MPRLTIEELNARRDRKAASGGSNKRSWRDLNDYAPAEPIDNAMLVISDFAFWAECSRERYLAAWGVKATVNDDMVF